MAGVNLGEGKEPELRIILVGKTGGGKSATGNTILGREEFVSILGVKTTTLTCQRGRGNWNGRDVSVIDTADLFDPEPCSEVSCNEIMRCIGLSKPGPHALVFVTQVGRFTAEDKAAVKQVQDVFGWEATKHMIVLFTRKEDLGDWALQDYVTGSDNRALRELLRQCGARCCAFNNRAVGAEREKQVSELMGTIQRMVRDNGGCHYVNELYSEPSLTGAKVRAYLEGNRRARQKAEGAAWSGRVARICPCLVMVFMLFYQCVFGCLQPLFKYPKRLYLRFTRVVRKLLECMNKIRRDPGSGFVARICWCLVSVFMIFYQFVAVILQSFWGCLQCSFNYLCSYF